jgi:hypothetical protein
MPGDVRGSDQEREQLLDDAGGRAATLVPEHASEPRGATPGRESSHIKIA